MDVTCSEFHDKGIEVIEQPDGSIHLVLTAAQAQKYYAFLSQQANAVTEQNTDLEPDDLGPILDPQLIFKTEQMPWGTELFPFVTSRGKTLCLMC